MGDLFAPLLRNILLMVQKSGDHQLRLVVYPIIYRVLAPSKRWLFRVSESKQYNPIVPISHRKWQEPKKPCRRAPPVFFERTSKMRKRYLLSILDLLYPKCPKIDLKSLPVNRITSRISSFRRPQSSCEGFSPAAVFNRRSGFWAPVFWCLFSNMKKSQVVFGNQHCTLSD